MDFVACIIAALATFGINVRTERRGVETLVFVNNKEYFAIHDHKFDNGTQPVRFYACAAREWYGIAYPQTVEYRIPHASIAVEGENWYIIDATAESIVDDFLREHADREDSAKRSHDEGWNEVRDAEYAMGG